MDGSTGDRAACRRQTEDCSIKRRPAQPTTTLPDISEKINTFSVYPGLLVGAGWRRFPFLQRVASLRADLLIGDVA